MNVRTPMFSRPGKSTIPQYLCFTYHKSKRHSKNELSSDKRNKGECDLEHRVNMILKSRMKRINKLSETKETHQTTDMNETTKRPNIFKQTLKPQNNLILNANKKHYAVPPLGYYQPDYDFIKPRVSSVCFHKSRERKSIFSSQVNNKNLRKVKKIVFDVNIKNLVHTKRPGTSFTHCRKRSYQLSPVASKTRHNINLFNDQIQLEECNSDKLNTNSSPNKQRSLSSMNKKSILSFKSPQAKTKKLVTSNTSYTFNNFMNGNNSLFL